MKSIPHRLGRYLYRWTIVFAWLIYGLAVGILIVGLTALGLAWFVATIVALIALAPIALAGFIIACPILLLTPQSLVDDWKAARPKEDDE